MQAKHLVALAGVFALCMAQPAAAAGQTPDSVSIPGGGKNEPATLDAMLFKPRFVGIWARNGAPATPGQEGRS